MKVYTPQQFSILESPVRFSHYKIDRNVSKERQKWISHPSGIAAEPSVFHVKTKGSSVRKSTIWAVPYTYLITIGWL